MRTPLVRLGTAAAAAAAAFGIMTAGPAVAATPTYQLMVKAPSPANTSHPVKAVEISVGKEGHAKKLGHCIPLRTYQKYTNTGLSVHRHDVITASLFTECHKGQGQGFIGSETLWGAKPKNIRHHEIWFDLNP